MGIQFECRDDEEGLPLEIFCQPLPSNNFASCHRLENLMMSAIPTPCFQNPCDEISVDFCPKNQTNISWKYFIEPIVIAGCEGRKAHRSVTARLTLSREFFERVLRAENTHGSTCYVRKHACESRCLIEQMLKTIKIVVLSAVRWTNEAAGSAPGST
jgi:hypothetical protein